jgi:hypothetical protein
MIEIDREIKTVVLEEREMDRCNEIRRLLYRYMSLQNRPRSRCNRTTVVRNRHKVENVSTFRRCFRYTWRSGTNCPTIIYLSSAVFSSLRTGNLRVPDDDPRGIKPRRIYCSPSIFAKPSLINSLFRVEWIAAAPHGWIPMSVREIPMEVHHRFKRFKSPSLEVEENPTHSNVEINRH